LINVDFCNLIPRTPSPSLRGTKQSAHVIARHEAICKRIYPVLVIARHEAICKRILFTDQIAAAEYHSLLKFQYVCSALNAVRQARNDVRAGTKQSVHEAC